MIWTTFKKGFDAWEDATARYAERWLESPLVLGPSGAMLKLMMQTRAATERALAQYWDQVGVATRHDQERTLHALTRIESRLSDLEERLGA